MGTKALGIGIEASYATKIAASTWFECLAESVHLEPVYQPVSTIRSVGVRRGSLQGAPVRGPFRCAANFQDIGHLFYWLFGDVVTSGAGPFVHTLPGATPTIVRKSATLEIQRDPDEGGATWKYLGCMLSELGFTVGIDALAEVSANIIGSSEVVEAGGSPTYPEFDLVVPTDCFVKLDGTILDAESFSVAISWPLDEPRKLGSTTFARQPRTADSMKVTGEFVLIGHNATQYAKFAAFSDVDVQLLASLAGAAPEELELNMNFCKLLAATPALEGAATPRARYAFETYLDPTLLVPIECKVTNDDAVIP